jgi:hypothetical protein
MLAPPNKKTKENLKMKEFENMKELIEVEEEMVAGGIMPPFNPGLPIKPDYPDDEPRDGGVTFSW